jgi:hypothetical protein
MVGYGASAKRPISSNGPFPDAVDDIKSAQAFSIGWQPSLFSISS